MQASLQPHPLKEGLPGIPATSALPVLTPAPRPCQAFLGVPCLCLGRPACDRFTLLLSAYPLHCPAASLLVRLAHRCSGLGCVLQMHRLKP